MVETDQSGEPLRAPAWQGWPRPSWPTGCGGLRGSRGLAGGRRGGGGKGQALKEMSKGNLGDCLHLGIRKFH